VRGTVVGVGAIGLVLLCCVLLDLSGTGESTFSLVES
jgi:hypothetical protein